jgi:hypothetical protein
MHSSADVMRNHDGLPAPETDGVDDKPMYENYTDAENTGAPLVPVIEEPTEVATDGGQATRTAYEEVILSHRLHE